MQWPIMDDANIPRRYASALHLVANRSADDNYPIPKPHQNRAFLESVVDSRYEPVLAAKNLQDPRQHNAGHHMPMHDVWLELR